MEEPTTLTTAETGDENRGALAQPALIVVHGAPASGKTYLCQWLAQELHLPLLSKDDIKEELFNHFDYQPADQFACIDVASFGLLWLWLDSLMAARNHSYIVETAFVEAQSQPKLTQLAHDHAYQVVQIYCHATEPVLRRRYIERARTADRHPGHQDLQRVENQPIPRESSFRAMDLPGYLIEIDTTDLDSINYQEVLVKLRGMLYQ